MSLAGLNTCADGLYDVTGLQHDASGYSTRTGKFQLWLVRESSQFW